MDNITIKEILVFSKEYSEINDILFSERERDFIEKNNISIRFSNQQIHKDDSIRILKNKLLKELDYKVSYPELYLFSAIQKNYNIEDIFQRVSKKQDYINKNIFQQLLKNLGLPFENLDEKTRFFYEDLYTIYENIKEKNQLSYAIPIGKKYRIEHNHLFSVNPYHILSDFPIADFISSNSSTNPLESFENQLLLNNNNAVFIDNTIYVCLSEDFFTFIKNNNLENSRENLIQLYYPLLDKDEISVKGLGILNELKILYSNFNIF